MLCVFVVAFCPYRISRTTEHTECTEQNIRIFLGDLGDLLRNTKFNAETAEAAGKKPIKLCDLCVLCVKTSWLGSSILRADAHGVFMLRGLRPRS